MYFNVLICMQEVNSQFLFVFIPLLYFLRPFVQHKRGQCCVQSHSWNHLHPCLPAVREISFTACSPTVSPQSGSQIWSMRRRRAQLSALWGFAGRSARCSTQASGGNLIEQCTSGGIRWFKDQARNIVTVSQK